VVALGLLVVFGIPLIRDFRRPRPGKNRQLAQLHSMTAALELHANEFAGHPPSDANDPVGVPYCGAMKLCEAVTGRDLLGMHTRSVFRADGPDTAGTLKLYLDDTEARRQVDRKALLEERRGPWLQPENANAHRLVDIYGEGRAGPFNPNTFVACDVHGRRTAIGMRTGMPILYYRAAPNGTAHDVDEPNNPNNIYDYRDNQMLLALGVPGEPNAVHPLSDPKRFYKNTQNTKIRGRSVPHNADKFILISAGYDGLYGTRDDICNFEWQYRK
jgi:hypothetical protein